jgi:hypothetical protein
VAMWVPLAMLPALSVAVHVSRTWQLATTAWS